MFHVHFPDKICLYMFYLSARLHIMGKNNNTIVHDLSLFEAELHECAGIPNPKLTGILGRRRPSLFMATLSRSLVVWI